MLRNYSKKENYTLVLYNGTELVTSASIWMSIPKGIVGIVLQLVLIPLLLYRVKDFSKNDE